MGGRRHRRSAVLVAVLIVALAGCGGGEPPAADGGERVVEITAHDSMAFDPPDIEVEAGETVTFEVTNDGEIVHEFVLGDEQTQREHADHMQEMDGAEDMHHDDPNVLTIEPGRTESLTWTFEEAGEVLYGCHQPGHYEAGMVGTVTVR